MKNRLIALLFNIILCTSLSAQTIHWIIFADTQDPSNGEEVRNSVSSMTTQFIDRINDAIGPKGYSPKQKIYSGSEFTERNCNQVIQNLNCGREDIIVFYYLGHGGRAYIKENEEAAYSKTHPWPDLQFNYRSGSREFTSLNFIHNKLKQKGARFTLTIGMCCNKSMSQYKRHGVSTQSKSSKYKTVSKKFAKKIGQRLFLKYKGDVLVASAQPGQFSYGGTYNDKDVDCFTAAICETFDKYANNDTGDNVTWDGFLSEVSVRCTNKAKAEGLKYSEEWIQKPKRLVNATLSK